jgi:hypothetical protein
MQYNQRNDKFSAKIKQNFETILRDKVHMMQDTCKDQANQ